MWQINHCNHVANMILCFLLVNKHIFRTKLEPCVFVFLYIVLGPIIIASAPDFKVWEKLCLELLKNDNAVFLSTLSLKAQPSSNFKICVLYWSTN